MKQLLKLTLGGFLAGASISVGAAIYLSCQSKVAGALLFSIGLILVVTYGFNLYTGMIGYVRSGRDLLRALWAFLANALGCTLSLLMPNGGAARAAELWQGKLENGLPIVFVRAVVCGVLIFACVNYAKKHGGVAALAYIVLAVAAFILCGAEHSVADICFLFAARAFSPQSVGFILVVAAGNAVGSLILSFWEERTRK